MVEFREYDPQKDRTSVTRIWKEIGWLKKGKEEYVDMIIKAGHGLVADVNGEGECLVVTTPGNIKYLKEDIPFSGVVSVGTSRVARKQGYAQRVTALAVAQDAARGALISGLGMFEQGFYDRLGFGTGSYEHKISFDPAYLRLDIKARMPSRLTEDDWKKVHESRLGRKRGHGVVTFLVPEITKIEMGWSKNGFGLGYYNNRGELTHHAWFEADKIEHGPYTINWMTYQTFEQFLELMAMIKTLGDQIRVIRMYEPPGIQLQDLIDNLFKIRQITQKSNYESNMHAFAWWQMRILDIKGCMEKTHLSGDDVLFNLVLDDPIESVLNNDAPWQGISGRYVVNLGKNSYAEKGEDSTLPTLTASVGAFTRMWLGVRPATGLAVTENLSGPRELLNDLDHILCIPVPHPDWGF